MLKNFYLKSLKEKKIVVSIKLFHISFFQKDGKLIISKSMFNFPPFLRDCRLRARKNLILYFSLFFKNQL